MAEIKRNNQQSGFWVSFTQLDKSLSFSVQLLSSLAAVALISHLGSFGFLLCCN
jgi:hypothetical protein